MRSKTYYQYYTNVTYSTPAECLALHGRIASAPSEFPHDDDCPRRILSFPRGELSYYREQARKMRAIAQAELRRRKLFREAEEALEEDPEMALELFTQASQIETYVPELELLLEKRGNFLSRTPELRRQLGEIFYRAYSDKFGRQRYERFPERMRLAREQAGLSRIKELFHLP